MSSAYPAAPLPLLLASLGVQQLIVAVNKLDNVDFSQVRPTRVEGGGSNEVGPISRLAGPISACSCLLSLEQAMRACLRAGRCRLRSSLPRARPIASA
jgi:hypothetical protein